MRYFTVLPWNRFRSDFVVTTTTTTRYYFIIVTSLKLGTEQGNNRDRIIKGHIRMVQSRMQHLFTRMLALCALTVDSQLSVFQNKQRDQRNNGFFRPTVGRPLPWTRSL